MAEVGGDVALPFTRLSFDTHEINYTTDNEIKTILVKNVIISRWKNFIAPISTFLLRVGNCFCCAERELVRMSFKTAVIELEFAAVSAKTSELVC